MTRAGNPPGRAATGSERYAVRPAAVADAPVLGRIHVQIWRETYGDLLPPENLAALDAGRSAAWWRQRLSAPAPVATALVGTGLAARLLQEALGERAAYLWVLEGNERAVAFYRRHGFAFDGGRQPYESTGATELRMVRS